MAVKLRIFQ